MQFRLTRWRRDVNICRGSTNTFLVLTVVNTYIVEEELLRKMQYVKKNQVKDIQKIHRNTFKNPSSISLTFYLESISEEQ